MKRILDIFIASLLIVPSAFLILVFGCLIILINRQNPLFIQARVGLNEKQFELIKLQTMKTGTQSLGTHEVEAQCVTLLGRFMRRCKVDELPQLVNVFRGHMSIVGPRPNLPNQLELIEHRRQRGIYSMRPGITGLSQVCGVDMSNPLKLAEHDQKYKNGMSLKLDLIILIKTLSGNGFGDVIRYN